ncbi:unnamed protein product [Calypogeia fissa]
MSIRSFCIDFSLLFVALSLPALSIECSRAEIKRELKFKSHKHPLFRPPNAVEIADFGAWVSREGQRAQLKELARTQQKAKSKVEGGSSSAIGGDKSYASIQSIQMYIVVDQSGNGQFTKVQDAIDSITPDETRTERITIQINPGYYNEKIVVPKNLPYLTIQGGGRLNTLVDHAETSEQAGSDIADATVAISAPNFIARNITFQNSAPAPPSGAVGQQATAVCVAGDMAAFYGCGIVGAQDTLYDHSGRHYFEECFIQGSIDFIYGDGKSLYKDSQLNVIPTMTGSLTAQKRMNSSEDTGFSFVDCAVAGAGRVYLGRAWGTYSRVVFAQTWLADILIPAGWDDWSDPARDSTVYYGEYNCFGPGSNSGGRVGWSHQLSYQEAAPFLDLSFVDGEYWVSS